MPARLGLVALCALTVCGCYGEVRSGVSSPSYQPGANGVAPGLKNYGVVLSATIGVAWDRQYAHRTVVSAGPAFETALRGADSAYLIGYGAGVAVRVQQALTRKPRLLGTVRVAAMRAALEHGDNNMELASDWGTGYVASAGLALATYHEQFGFSQTAMLELGYGSMATDDAGTLSGPQLAVGTTVLWVPKFMRNEKAPSQRATDAFEGFQARGDDDRITALKIAALDLGCQLRQTSRKQLIAMCTALEVRVRRDADDGLEVACAKGRLAECQQLFAKLSAAAPP